MRGRTGWTCAVALLVAGGTVAAAQEPPLWFDPPGETASIDGTDNNLAHPEQGATDTPLLRAAPADYADGAGALAGPARLSPREISNLVAAQDEPVFSIVGATDMFWLWGQFLDHDIDLTLVTQEAEPIPVPLGDPFFDPDQTGQETIDFTRSVFELIDGVRQQTNDITTYIDASNVYGSDPARASALRKLDGSGELETEAGDLLPLDPDNPGFFLAGDERVNENIYLTSMHTLWMREHNSWAQFFKSGAPWMNGDQVYLLARSMVAAEIQSITYNEFLPMLLGPDGLPPYTGYDPGVDATIATEFSTAAYRFGHTMLSGTLLRLEASGDPIAQGPIQLRDAFNNPAAVAETGVSPMLFGAAGQAAQDIDNQIIDDVRNFLFGPPGSGGLDLASLNLQRGRDHGIPDYNSVRVAYGLPPRPSIASISSDPETVARLEAAYGDVNDMDLWITGLAEDPAPGAMVGETFRAIIADQFRRLRDGDRFYFENSLPSHMADLARHTRLSTVIRRNTDATINDLQHEVLALQPEAEDALRGFESAQQWSSDNADLTLNTAYATDGEASLDVAGSGYMVVVGSDMPVSNFADKDEITVDVFIPEEQPNPYWVGAVQTFLTCSSGELQNRFVGQTELTNLPRGQFNTAVHPISSEIQDEIPAQGSCRVDIALNVNQTSTPFSLDRLRLR